MRASPIKGPTVSPWPVKTVLQEAGTLFGESVASLENYRHVMGVCESEQRWERVVELYREMLMAHVQPDDDIHQR
jgi:pentatricopeptide repeat protein